MKVKCNAVPNPRACARWSTWRVILTTGVVMYYCSAHKGARKSSYQGYVWEKMK